MRPRCCKRVAHEAEQERTLQMPLLPERESSQGRNENLHVMLCKFPPLFRALNRMEDVMVLGWALQALGVIRAWRRRKKELLMGW